MTRSLLASVVLVLSAAGSALAQTRPLQTEEATTATAGRIALEAGATVMAKERNFLAGSVRTRWDVRPNRARASEGMRTALGSGLARTVVPSGPVNEGYG